MLKVFVIGSGPIVIGQAAEFDYSGTQAIKALKEEGYQVVLLNNNPATIMTDLELADVLYSEPMTVESAVAIIEKESPHAIVLGMGGQTALNLGIKLHEAGVLKKHAIEIFGTAPVDIQRAEDRELFKQEMIAIGEPVMESRSVNTISEALEAAEHIGYPVIVRPAFTLGGFGGGICDNAKELELIAGDGIKKSPVSQVLIERSVFGWKEIEYEMMRDGEGNAISVCNMENFDPVAALEAAEHIGYPVIVRPAFTLGGFGGGICDNAKELELIAGDGIKKSPVSQVLIERSVFGWKEIEYEMMRDGEGNAISVCNMENFDPVGIHTGDSIVVAPSQTLNDKQYQMLRQSAIRIVNHLNIIGGCNVQYALSATDNRYYIIEVNPRVSRSSALASKATGYAIAKIAMKIGMGYNLDQIQNQVTQKTMACHEPTLDYCVVKMPRWPYDKLTSDVTALGTVMKATGEVMAIGTTFEEALLKALRSLDLQQHDLYDVHMSNLTSQVLYKLCIDKDYNRIFALAELIRRGESIAEINEKTHIDDYFLRRLAACVAIEATLKAAGGFKQLSYETLKRIKCMGFSNHSLAKLAKTPIDRVSEHLEALAIRPVYRMVDTCGGEFEAYSNYLYSTYHGSNESIKSDRKKIIVIGSGPIRIGQGVEFDYSSVKALMAIRKLGYEAIMVNNNPETVSTDHDLSDKLYFEPITLEDVMAIVRHEEPHGVLLQFGGQTAIKLAAELELRGVPLLGVSSHMIDQVEDRALFYQMLDALEIPRAIGKTTASEQEALAFAKEKGYPVLLRPSFVIGGQDMVIVREPAGIVGYFAEMRKKYSEVEILVDQYLEGVELEVDAVADGEDIFIPGFMEHLDQAGVHSGDSISIYPARLSKLQMITLYSYVEKVVRHLQYRGVINFQFVKYENTIYVLEVNPRASRSLPFIAKVTKTPMIQWAVGLSLGLSLNEVGVASGMLPSMNYAAVKAPVFSNEKLLGIDPLLGPNMLSTGESMFIAPTLTEALDKLLVADGIHLKDLKLLLYVTEEEARHYVKANKRGLMPHDVYWVKPNTMVVGEQVAVAHLGDVETTKRFIQSEGIDVVITTKDFAEGASPLGKRLRSATVEMGIACVTSPDKFRLIVTHLEQGGSETQIFAMRA